jgi:hypothetical protein
MGEAGGFIMLAIKARVTGGYLVSVGPVDLPEGTEVEVTTNLSGTLGMDQMTEDNWPTTDEDRARLLARMESREPVQMSDAEVADWARIRRDEKAWDLAHADEQDERLRKVWE